MTTFNQNFNNLVAAALQADDQQIKTEQKTEMSSKNNKILNLDKSAKSQDFFQDNNAVKIKYTITRIKSTNSLSNITYTGINKNYYNKNFIFDVYLLLTKNLDPFSLDRKLTDKTKHEMIYMLWREYILIEYYKFICEENNFLYLIGKNVLQLKVLQIIADFIEKDKKNYKLLQNNLATYNNIF